MKNNNMYKSVRKGRLIIPIPNHDYFDNPRRITQLNPISKLESRSSSDSIEVFSEKCKENG